MSRFPDIYPKLEKFLPWLAVMLVILVYLPALANGFVWDDHITLFQSDAYRDPRIPYAEVFLRPLIYSGNYYRPLPVLSFMFETRNFGLNPWHYHLVSIALHGANTFLLAVVISAFLPADARYRKAAAGVGALAYGLHPALVEPVVYVASRFDLMATLFTLLALVSDRRIRRPGWRAAAVALFFLPAALCKETVISFALTLPLLHLLSRDRFPQNPAVAIDQFRKTGDLYTYAGIIAGGSVYLVLRGLALGNILDPDLVAAVPAGSILQRTLLVGRSFYEYITLILVPFARLSPSHAVDLPATANDLRNIGGTLMFAFVLIASILLVWRQKAVGWWLLLWPAALFPILGFVPPPRPLGAYFAESYLVLPLALVVIVTTVLGIRVTVSWQPQASKRILATGLTLWGTICLFTVVTTISLWRSDITLWSWARYHQPDNILVLQNLTNGYLAQGDYRRALVHASRYRQLAPDRARAWASLANALIGLNRLDEAESATRKALALDKAHHISWVNLGDILYRKGRYREAQRTYVRALSLRPENYRARAKLGAALFALGRRDEALEQLDQVLASLPEGADRGQLYDMYRSMQRQGSAASETRTRRHVVRSP